MRWVNRVGLPRAAAALPVSLILITLTACATLSPADPAPYVPFGEFTVTETGGVDGRRNVLVVRADGVAVAMSGHPRAGQLPTADLARLRSLLTSEQFRREVAEPPPNAEPARCSDQVTVTVAMGSLSTGRTGPCDDGRSGATPAYDEIVSITASARQGSFDLPVPGGPPELTAARLDRSADADSPPATILLTAAGRVFVPTGPHPRDHADLQPDERDTLRLLLVRLSEQPAQSCARPGTYRLAIAGSPATTVVECLFVAQPELRAVVALLEDVAPA